MVRGCLTVHSVTLCRVLDPLSGSTSGQVRGLRRRGAVILAKANMGEFAWSPFESRGSLFGVVRNPYNTSRTVAGASLLIPQLGATRAQQHIADDHCFTRNTAVHRAPALQGPAAAALQPWLPGLRRRRWVPTRATAHAALHRTAPASGCGPPSAAPAAMAPSLQGANFLSDSRPTLHEQDLHIVCAVTLQRRCSCQHGGNCEFPLLVVQTES